MDEATEAMPGLARIAATAWLRPAAWALDGLRVDPAAGRRRPDDPDAGGELVQEVGTTVAAVRATSAARCPPACR